MTRSWFPTFFAWFVAWRDNLSVAGKTLTGLLVVSIPSLGAPESPLAALAIASLVLLLVVGAASRFYRPRIRTTHPVRETTIQGDRVELVLEVENPYSRPVFDVHLDLARPPESWEVLLRPPPLEILESRAKARIAFSILPHRRGVYHLPPLAASSNFPLNLVRRSRESPLRGELLVQPRFEPLRAFDAAAADQQHTGEHLRLSMLTGQGADYAGSREYQPGVAVRRWDYASWARIQRPVAREFADDQQTTFDLIIDSHINEDDAEALVAFEAMISLTAALSDWFARHECRIATMILGDTTLHLTADGPGQHDAAMDVLTRAHPATSSQTPRILSEVEGVSVGTFETILLTTRWDANRQALCEQLRQLGHPVSPLVLAELSDRVGTAAAQFVSPSEVLAGRVAAL